ncbi:DUF6247 family protein [Streptomyces sp. NPDC060000]|uniref:DUF6247 family protein n=1 Tax=Streptomyces sp. NPDC060000 TaxID=3347031 RepID=UPI0036CF80AD
MTTSRMMCPRSRPPPTRRPPLPGRSRRTAPGRGADERAAEQAPAPPPPAAAAQLRADRRADTWVPAFERDWAKALEDSRHSYSLTPLHDVVRAWQLRVAAAPAIDAYMGSGRDESGFVDLDDVLGARR